MFNIKFRKIYIFLFFILLFLILGAIYLKANYAGYCVSEFRYINDEEKIRRGLTVFLENYDKVYVKDLYKKEYSYKKGPLIYYYIGYLLPYKGLDDFLNKNPNCCQITLTHKGLEGSGAPEIDKYMGDVYGFLDIHYSYFYKDENDNIQEVKNSVFYPISNCAKLNKMSVLQDRFKF